MKYLILYSPESEQNGIISSGPIGVTNLNYLYEITDAANLDKRVVYLKEQGKKIVKIFRGEDLPFKIETKVVFGEEK